MPLFDPMAGAKPPHPNEVILNGRMRAAQLPILRAMFADFKHMTKDDQIEFLFWSLSDMAVYNMTLKQQVDHWTQMLKQLSDDGKAKIDD